MRDDPWGPFAGGFTREQLTEERMARLAKQVGEQPGFTALSEAEREVSRTAILKAKTAKPGRVDFRVRLVDVESCDPCG